MCKTYSKDCMFGSTCIFMMFGSCVTLWFWILFPVWFVLVSFSFFVPPSLPPPFFIFVHLPPLFHCDCHLITVCCRSPQYSTVLFLTALSCICVSVSFLLSPVSCCTLCAFVSVGIKYVEILLKINICCILLVFSIISQFAHDARSQKPKAK